MSMTILLLLLFTALLLVYGWRNKYFYLYAVLVVSMTLSMFSLTVEVARVSNYLVPANFLIRSLETRLYAMCYSMMKIPLSTLMIIRNAGVVGYFGGIVCFVRSFSSSVRLDEAADKKRRLALQYVPLIGLPLLFFVFYHPQTAYRFFHYYHTLTDAARMQQFVSLIRLADSAMTFCVLIYLLWPVLFLLINYRRGRITFLSGFLLRLAGTLLILNISFFMLFFTGVFRVSCQDVMQYGFWRFTLPLQMPVFYTSLLPIITFILLVAIFVTLMHLHDDYILSFFKSRGIRRNLNALYANVRNVMHSEKNLLFTIRILTQDALETADELERARKMEKILDLCNQNMDDLARTLNDAHDMNVSTVRNDFIGAVETALANLRVPESVEIERDYPGDTLPLFFDIYHMTHAVGNVLINSLDALAAAAPEHPKIRLTIYTSRNWVYFSVWDNGCGIPAKILHKVEQPYVSTKNKKNSWGIGLSYVFNVIRAHYGQMHIRSQQNVFTQVEILLPRSRRRR